MRGPAVSSVGHWTTVLRWAQATSDQDRKAGAGLGPMPSGEGLRQLVPGRLAGRMLTASEGRHGRLRPDAMLGALELVVAHVVRDRMGVKVQAAADEGQQPVSSSSI